MAPVPMKSLISKQSSTLHNHHDSFLTQCQSPSIAVVWAKPQQALDIIWVFEKRDQIFRGYLRAQAKADFGPRVPWSIAYCELRAKRRARVHHDNVIERSWCVRVDEQLVHLAFIIGGAWSQDRPDMASGQGPRRAKGE